MLVARGQKVVRGASLRWALAFTRGGWFKLVETEGLVFDSRFVPPDPGPAKDQPALYAVTRGTYEGFAAGTAAATERFGERTCMSMRLAHMEGASGARSYAYRAAGNPHAALEIHLDAADVRHLPEQPTVLDLDDEAWAAATRAAALSQNDDDALVAGLRGLLRGLIRADLLREAAAERAMAGPPKTLQRLWRGVQPMIERFAVAVTMGEIGEAAGLTSSQLERSLQRWVASYALAGPGLRSVTLRLRLKTALLFLSAEDIPVSEVAEIAGYGSVEAMGRAFRDAGLHPPSTVRADLTR